MNKEIKSYDSINDQSYRICDRYRHSTVGKKRFFTTMNMRIRYLYETKQLFFFPLSLECFIVDARANEE